MAMTYRDIVLLPLCIRALWHRGNAPGDVPCQYNLHGGDVVLGGELADRGVAADGVVARGRVSGEDDTLLVAIVLEFLLDEVRVHPT